MNEYTFYGMATVSVKCTVEADSEEHAMALVECGDCEWVCDMVDGDVDNIEMVDCD